MSSHPLEEMERNVSKEIGGYICTTLSLQYEVSREKLTYDALRHSQGLHAPLKLKMERMLVSKVTNLKCIV